MPKAVRWVAVGLMCSGEQGDCLPAEREVVSKAARAGSALQEKGVVLWLYVLS